MKSKYNMVEVKADEVPRAKSYVKKGVWKSFIQEFINSDMNAARVTTDNADEKTQRRAYSGLMMAIRRSFSKENISVVWRHGNVYLLKGFGLEVADK